MSRSNLSIAVTPLLFAALCAAQPKFANGVHEDARVGIKIKVPDKWSMVPIDIDEKWIVAKYLCHRDYEGKTAYTIHKPEMRIIHFTADKAKPKEKTETRGDTTYTVKTATFRNYKDWFKEYMKGGRGFHIQSEKAGMIGDIPVTRIEMITDQGAAGAMKFVACVYERKSDNSTIAVDFSQLDDYYKNVADDFERTFKSMKFIEVAAAAGATAADSELETPAWTLDRAKWRELPKLERWKIRQGMETKRRNKILAHVPEGWKVKESKSKRFTAISHADDKYTSLVLDTAEATWDWLDKRFGEISDEYVMAGTIRICKNWDEAASYGAKSASGDSYSWDNREIVDWKDRDAGSSGGGQWNLQQGLLSMYLLDKDHHALYTPSWLDIALATYLQSGEVDGKKLSFKSDTWERLYISEAEREGALRSFSELVNTLSDDFPREWRPFARLRSQLAAMIRFLESKDCPKPLANLIPRYVAAVIKAADQWKKDHPTTGQAKTEQEEEERAKGNAKAFREREKFVIDFVTKQEMNLSPKEWQQIEAAWKKWLTK